MSALQGSPASRIGFSWDEESVTLLYGESYSSSPQTQSIHEERLTVCSVDLSENHRDHGHSITLSGHSCFRRSTLGDSPDATRDRDRYMYWP